jgi:photosystem II stability/assembly factor-like uncharacterized protein
VVEPDTLVVSIEDVANFLVTTFDSTGAEVVAPVTWTSADEGVCLVNNSGQVTGVTEGVTSVIATSGAVSDTAVVIVTPGSGGWLVQTSSLSGSRFNGVFFLPDGRNGWACGDGGRIVRTSDAGSSWSIMTTPTTSRLNAIWFVDADLGFTVGDAGLVLTTVDGGTTWTRILTVPAAENLHDVHFANADSGWVVGAAGVGLRTIDGGATWERVGMAVTDLNGVSFFGSKEGWAVGNGGIILGTVDGGESWSLVQPSVTGLTLMGVWRVSAERANAVGVGGAAPRTVAGTWEFVNAGSLFSLEDVCFVDDNTGWAVGQNVTGAILRTDNGGATWTTQAPNTSARLRDVFFVDRFRGWAVGDNGTILHTVSGGAP